MVRSGFVFLLPLLQETVKTPHAFAPRTCFPFSETRARMSASATRLHYYRGGSDVQITSDHASNNPNEGDHFTSNSLPSLVELEAMDDETLRKLEAQDESIAAIVRRQRAIQEALHEEDIRWREERKRERMGKFANATTYEEVLELENKERERIRKDNEIKRNLAQESGVFMELLEPTDVSDSDHEFAEGAEKVEMNVKGRKASWFEKLDKEIDEEIKREQDELVAGSNKKEFTAGTKFVNGKMVSREALQGIRVGSAGGWSLEVFPGDYVVHRKFGIGRFDGTVLSTKPNLTEEEKAASEERRKVLLREASQRGMSTEEIVAISEKFGTEEDKDPISRPLQTMLELSYADGKIHVPVDRAYRISRYRGGGGSVKPKLSKIKGEAWAKAKQKVEDNTIQMAEDVLALYATRETLQRTPFDPALEESVSEFESTFPYEPTPDQQICFEDVENDMVWRNRPMDRLVCGDVGFGKTEVAMRALFRTVTNGRQGALLAPTGVLASQHFKNIVARMGSDTRFNVEVALLRGGMGKNTKAGKALRAQIETGEVQLIVGTHALLSGDMKFHDLGLLVVDEEQRFGVKQKERLKLICNGVDVLTLSATPIPRTLQMSLSGIRDTSTIRSPPPMRKPIKTIVTDFQKEVVELAIETELARGGQCFYVLPRIQMMEDAEKMVKSLFPKIRLITAHGRMQRDGAERNVAAFAEGEYDVLIATTVIENGVDIPSVNTIIIENAQSFGMSTLYQLRGRVGRSNQQAYAYLLHKPNSLTEESAMRLQAMADLHELGSGFDIANRDLEIRGAGSLLGTEQSGIAAKVGFDLYMRMLKKSIRQLRGLDLPRVLRTKMVLPNDEGSIEVGTGPDAKNNALQIPESFIPDRTERMKQESLARLAESTTALVELTNNWKTTYGPIPASVQTKLKSLHLHTCTRLLGIDLVGLQDNGEGRLDCILRSPGLRPRHVAQIAQLLPKGVLTKGLEIIFPARFMRSPNDFTFVGGKKYNFHPLLALSDDDESSGWDSLDEEEVEAMKQISSAAKVKSLEEVDLEKYPRLVIKNLGSVKEGLRVEALLKFLLPPTKAVFEKQHADQEKARQAAELREKREELKKKQKQAQKPKSKRNGYRY